MNGTLLFSVKLNDANKSDIIKSNVLFHNCHETGHRAGDDEVEKLTDEKHQLKQVFQLDSLPPGQTRLTTHIRDGGDVLGTIEIPVSDEMRQAIRLRQEFELRGHELLFDPGTDDADGPIGSVKWKFIVSDHRPLPKKKKRKKKSAEAKVEVAPEPVDIDKPLDFLELPAPKPVQDEPDACIFVEENELSKSGRRELEILVHCATSIYKKGTKDPPCAFVALKSLLDHETDQIAQSSTSVAEESLTPEWGEALRIYFSASREMRTILKIIDFDEGETLHSFVIETAMFKPHINYNIELVNDKSPDTSIFLSVMRKHHLMDAQSLEMTICNTDGFVNKDNLDYHMIVRPVTDMRTYRQHHLQPVLDGTERSPVIHFEKLKTGQEAKVQRPNPAIGYPICLPKSSQPLPDGPLQWWHNLIIRQQCLNEVFIEASGIIVELYESRILAPNQHEAITPRPPVAVGEIRLNYVERELLLKLSNGIRLKQIVFPKLHLDQVQLPELNVTMRFVPRNQKRILSRHIVDDIQVITVEQLNYVYEKEADHLLNLDKKDQKKKSQFDVQEEVLNIIRGEAETPSEAETVDTLDLRPVNKKEVALVELSRDFLALKAATEYVEDENARLKGEINQLILNDREKQIFLEKGLENTRPIEMAHEYITMRGKHKKVAEENTFLNHKVNEFENNLKIGVSQLNDLTIEFDEIRTSYGLGEVKLSQLKKRLKSQTKLEELAKEQESIIQKLEDLFMQTKVTIDTQWRHDMNDLMEEVRQRKMQQQLGPMIGYPNMPMAIAPPMMMPANHVTNHQANFDSKAKELQEAHTKELEKIRVEIGEIETKQNEKIGTLTADLSMRSNKDEVQALNQRIEALTKKLPPSQTSILESVKKSLTELIEPAERADSGDHQKQQSSRTDTHIVSGGEGGDSLATDETQSAVVDADDTHNLSEVNDPTPQPKQDSSIRETKTLKGIWGLLKT